VAEAYYRNVVIAHRAATLGPRPSLPSLSSGAGWSALDPAVDVEGEDVVEEVVEEEEGRGGEGGEEAGRGGRQRGRAGRVRGGVRVLRRKDLLAVGGGGGQGGPSISSITI